MYEKNHEWSGYKITESAKGFIVTFWSRVQGAVDGCKYLYGFDKEFRPGIDLSISWNESMTYGDYLAKTIREQYKTAKEYGQKSNIKCLSKGHKVS